MQPNRNNNPKHLTVRIYPREYSEWDDIMRLGFSVGQFFSCLSKLAKVGARGVGAWDVAMKTFSLSIFKKEL